MAEPNLDIGLDYTGGIEKPTLADVGRFARVTLDSEGGPNFEYVDGVERRLAYFSSFTTLTGTTTKTVAGTLYKVPANKALDSRVRIRVRALVEFPVSVGTQIGLDFFGNATTTAIDIFSTTAVAPSANTPTVYECTIFPASQLVQRSQGLLQVNTLPNYLTTSGIAADMGFEQEIRLFGKLSNGADTIVYRRIEVFGIGL